MPEHKHEPGCGCPPPEEILNTQLEFIERVGWGVTAVNDHPHHAYTHGLWHSKKHPELCIFGLPNINVMDINKNPTHLIFAILWEHRINVDKPLQHGEELVDLLGNGYNLRVVKIAEDQDIWDRWFGMGQNINMTLLNQPMVPMFQIVWQDRNHRYPWEKWYSIAACTQPVLSDDPTGPV